MFLVYQVIFAYYIHRFLSDITFLMITEHFACLWKWIFAVKELNYSVVLNSGQKCYVTVASRCDCVQVYKCWQVVDVKKLIHFFPKLARLETHPAADLLRWLISQSRCTVLRCAVKCAEERKRCGSLVFIG